ncbi:MAG TPA: glycosyltransferase family 1 protein [Opitutus sp.]|nr:glycosyltransferase family 1 protein [Opitutus sp.]
MRIGIGLNLLRPDTGGIGNYALTLLRHWPAFAPEHELVLFSFVHNDEMLAQLPPASRRREIRLRTQEEVLQHLDQFDVYFCPFGSLWPRPFPRPSVLAFHDMQERFYPQFFTAAQLEERFFHYDWSLRMADAVVAVSDFTRRCCIDIVGTDPRKIRTVHHAPDDLPPPQAPAGWDAAGWEQFLFYPANFWDHKNHRRLLAALVQLRADGLAVRCVFTGALLGRDADWRALVAETGVADLVRHLGRRPRAELSWLYRHARGLAFPSLMEGFGIPLIEAMHSGCPIACANRTSLPEIARDAAVYFDPTSESDLARALAQLWTDDALHTSLADRARARAAAFTAQRLVRGHVEVFELARRRYRPWRHWHRTLFLKPKSEHPRHALLPREAAAAARLLQPSPTATSPQPAP